MAGENGRDEIAEYIQVKSLAKTWETLWQDLADYIMPRKSAITERKTHDVEGWTDSVFNNDAVHANNVSAAGSYDYLFAGRFFDCEPPQELKDKPRAKRWYRECAERMIADLAGSNFQTEIHEALLDRGGFGTCHLHLEEGEKSFYQFSNANVGKFYCEEDAEGFVNRIWILWERTACQIVEQFGEENCPKEVLTDYRDVQKKHNQRNVIQSIKPRDKSKRKSGSLLADSKEIASIWTDEATKHIFRNSGYDDMPSFVSRYLKWGSDAYGYCPGIEILPTAKQLNFIEMVMDAQAEVTVFPRMLWPSNMPGNINVYAGGVTLVDPNNSSKQDYPKEWMTAGRLDEMDKRLERKKQAIDRAYHVDLFRMLAQRDRDMTAREVVERVAEKLVNFSPTYGRITTELVSPIVQRMFSMALKAGRFSEPPPEVVQFNKFTGDGFIPQPKITYISKIALALRALQNRNFQEYMSIMTPVFEAFPNAAIGVNWEQISKTVGENSGLPVEFMHTEQVISDLKEQQAQDAQMEQATQAAAMGAKAAKDASAVNPAKLEGMMGQMS